MCMSILEAKKGDQWPPEEHTARIESYKHNRLLLRSRHDEAFERVQKWLDKSPDASLVYIVANFPKLVSLVCADLLFGEEPAITAGEDGSKTSETLATIVKANGLHTLNYEMAVGSSARGDCVYKLRYGQRYEYSERAEAIVTAVNPSLFYPQFAQDDCRLMTGAVIAWERELAKERYLCREIYLPGKIRHELWRMERGGQLGPQVPLNTLPEYAGLKEEEETGYPGLLVWYVPNWRMDDDWRGISDYEGIDSLVDELNNRLSRISRVLDKHENPKLILPPGLMQFDPKTQRYYIAKEALDVIEVGPDVGVNLPRYLVWDAQLSAAFAQIDKIVEMAFMVSETSPDAFGMGKSGAAESGRALKFRLLRTLAKVNRKKRYFDEALKQVLHAALTLESQRGPSSFDVPDIDITWRDGLPDDEQEETEIAASGVQAGIMSRRTAVRQLQRLSGQALEDELAEIGADQQMAAAPGVSMTNVAGLFEGLDLGAPAEAE